MNSANAETVLMGVSDEVKVRDESKFFVSQYIVSPSASMIIRNPSSSLYAQSRELIAALPYLVPRHGQSGNIIMTDFVTSTEINR